MSNSIELDNVERGILGFLIFLFLVILYFLTEIVIGIAALILIWLGLGFAAEKIIKHLEEKQK